MDFLKTKKRKKLILVGFLMIALVLTMPWKLHYYEVWLEQYVFFEGKRIKMTMDDYYNENYENLSTAFELKPGFYKNTYYQTCEKGFSHHTFEYLEENEIYCIRPVNWRKYRNIRHDALQWYVLIKKVNLEDTEWEWFYFFHQLAPFLDIF